MCTHRAFRHGKLGKSAAPLLVALLGESHPLTRRDLANLLGREVRAVYKPLKRLVDHKVVTVTDALYSLDPAWQEALEQAALVTGADRTEERQRAAHDAERFVFRARLERRNAPEVLREAA